MVQRRQLLLGGAAIAAMAALGLGADLLSKSEIVAAVRRRLQGLKLDEAGLHAFASDQVAALLAKRPTWYRMKYHLHSMFAKPVARYGFSTDNRSHRERIEDNLATIFLLSSDFFPQGAVETRVVRYVALYDPMRACGNPFARPAQDSASAV